MVYCIAGIFCGGGLIFAFFAMERIHKKFTAGMYLRCTNNKPVNKFCNTFIYSYVKICHRTKYQLYGTIHLHNKDMSSNHMTMLHRLINLYPTLTARFSISSESDITDTFITSISIKTSGITSTVHLTQLTLIDIYNNTQTPVCIQSCSVIRQIYAPTSMQKGFLLLIKQT